MLRKWINRQLFRLKNPTCRIGVNVRISRKVKVGRNCQIGDSVIISDSVKIGDNVIVGPGCSLRHLDIGNNCHLESGIKIMGTGRGRIKIGDHCYIGVNNILDSSHNIVIGDYVHLAGPSTALWCHSSAQMCINGIPLKNPDRDKYRPSNPIIIMNKVYIGPNCTIYPDTTIEEMTIIAPNSAVSGKLESKSMYGGVPTRLIKRII